MFFRATIRRLFPVACAAAMLCAPDVAHVPHAPVPASRPVAVLSRDNLLGASTDWRMRGCFSATPPFNLWHASTTERSAP